MKNEDRRAMLFKLGQHLDLLLQGWQIDECCLVLCRNFQALKEIISKLLLGRLLCKSLYSMI